MDLSLTFSSINFLFLIMFLQLENIKITVTIVDSSLLIINQKYWFLVLRAREGIYPFFVHVYIYICIYKILSKLSFRRDEIFLLKMIFLKGSSEQPSVDYSRIQRERRKNPRLDSSICNEKRDARRVCATREPAVGVERARLW